MGFLYSVSKTEKGCKITVYSGQPYFGDLVVKFNVRVFVRQTLIWFRVPGFIDALGNVIYCKRQKALIYYQATICHFSID